MVMTPNREVCLSGAPSHGGYVMGVRYWEKFRNPLKSAEH